MARKSKEEAERTREKILTSALALFVKKGYEHTSFNDIAARLKLTKGAVYWHFDSKEELLLELVRRACERFRQQIEAVMPPGELTFRAVADMMVVNALRVSGDKRAAQFFKLMKCGIEWTDHRSAALRDQLVESVTFGPKEAFRVALRNDMAAGRIREIDVEEVSTVVIALWDGLVQAKIDGFLSCDLERTLRNSYGAIANNISIARAD